MITVAGKDVTRGSRFEKQTNNFFALAIIYILLCDILCRRIANIIAVFAVIHDSFYVFL